MAQAVWLFIRKQVSPVRYDPESQSRVRCPAQSGLRDYCPHRCFGGQWLDDVIRRARAYREAGADLIFVDGIKTHADIKRYVQELGDLPLLYNGQLLPVQELAKYGFTLTIYSATLMAAYLRMRDAMQELKTTGSITQNAGWESFEELTTLLGVPEAMELGRKYEQ